MFLIHNLFIDPELFAINTKDGFEDKMFKAKAGPTQGQGQTTSSLEAKARPFRGQVKA